MTTLARDADAIRAVDAGPDVPVSLFLVDLEQLARQADCAPREPHDAERAARFHFERDRRRYLAARFALRRVLADALGTGIEAIRLGEESGGKPCIAAPAAPALHFNVSHSDGVALIALGADAPVGVDVELGLRLGDVDGLAHSCLSVEELPQWHGLPAMGRERRFLGLWTRKEALLKALGLGLSVEPSSFSTGFGPEPVTLRVQDRTVSVWSIDLGPVAPAAAVARLHPKD